MRSLKRFKEYEKMCKYRANVLRGRTVQVWICRASGVAPKGTE